MVLLGVSIHQDDFGWGRLLTENSMLKDLVKVDFVECLGSLRVPPPPKLAPFQIAELRPLAAFSLQWPSSILFILNK